MATSKSDNYHHGDLRNALLKSAMEIIAIEGAEKISIRGIAARAGVSSMALYRHFPDKDALLLAVAEKGFVELRDALKQADANAAHGEALKAQAVTYVVFASQHPALFRLMFGPVTSNAPRAHQDEGDTAYDVLARRIAKEVTSDDPESFTAGSWALVHGLAVLIMDGRLPAIEDGHMVPQVERIIAAMLSRKSVGHL